MKCFIAHPHCEIAVVHTHQKHKLAFFKNKTDHTKKFAQPSCFWIFRHLKVSTKPVEVATIPSTCRVLIKNVHMHISENENKSKWPLTEYA